MRTVLFLLVMSVAAPAWASESPAEPAARQKPASTQTEHSFDELLVQGKYHFSDESVTTVEEDKVLDALIGVRADFKDRLEDSSGKF